eukprot:621209_1
MFHQKKRGRGRGGFRGKRGRGRGRRWSISSSSTGTPTKPTNAECRFFARGHCHYGEKCSYSHQSPKAPKDAKKVTTTPAKSESVPVVHKKRPPENTNEPVAKRIKSGPLSLKQEAFLKLPVLDRQWVSHDGLKFTKPKRKRKTSDLYGNMADGLIEPGDIDDTMASPISLSEDSENSCSDINPLAGVTTASTDLRARATDLSINKPPVPIVSLIDESDDVAVIEDSLNVDECANKSLNSSNSSINSASTAPFDLTASADGSTCLTDTFTVLSYNILADKFVNSEMYPNCSAEILDRQFRHLNIAREIKHMDCDVVCMQEVQFFDEWKEKFETWGYSAVFQKRTGDKVDGCIIAYKNSKFELISKKVVEFRKYPSPLSKDNIALICVLQLKQDDDDDLLECKRVCIATTHILFNPDRGEQKLGQLQMLMHTVKQVMPAGPVILGGDFNCLPQSPLFRFITEGSLDYVGLDRRLLDATSQMKKHFEEKLSKRAIVTLKNLPKKWLCKGPEPFFSIRSSAMYRINSHDTASSVHHDLSLKSAFSECFEDGDIRVTSHTRDFLGMLDYIFFSPKYLRLAATYELPRQAQIRSLGFLPNEHQSSDHMTVAARFKWGTEA